MMATRRQMSVASARMWVLSSTACSPPKDADDLAGLVDLPGIEPGGRLVEQEHLGAAEQGLREPDPLPVAARDLVDLVPEHRLQATGGRDALELGRMSARGTPLALATKRR